ncbi:MAG: FG-GAP repeat protein [Myxococcales bacterium]|nr:FG-GAP repeat protein [Myxococcales bacterium]
MRRETRTNATLAASLALSACFNPPPADDPTTAPTAPSSSSSVGSAALTDDPATTSTTSTTEPATSHGPTPDDTTRASTVTGEPDPTGTATTTVGSDTATTDGPGFGFEVAGTIALNSPYALAAGDFDGDDLDDLAVTSSSPQNPEFSVIYGATPDTPHAYSAGDAVALALADFDGDGFDDVALAQLSTSSLVSYLRDPDNDLFMAATPTPLAPECTQPSSLALGQINPMTDGFTDAVVGCLGAGETRLLSGLMNGNWALPVAATPMTMLLADSVGLAEITATDAVDLVVVSPPQNTVTVFAGNDVTFNELMPAEFTVKNGAGVAVGRLDADDYPDFAVASRTDGTCHLFHGSKFTVTEKPAQPCGGALEDVALADFTDDGLDDLLTLHTDELHVAVNLGDGTFAPPFIAPLAGPALRATTGFFNDDPLRDIALTTATAVVVLHQTP